MGILDKVTSLLPWRSERRAAPPTGSEAVALRDDLDRWLQQLFEEPAPGLPSVTVRESDDELIVTLAVPGFAREDLDLTITPEGLTIRGERRAEQDDGHIHDSFLRTISLPPGLDVDRAEARVKNGVLTVRFPKTTARPGTRRIPVRT